MALRIFMRAGMHKSGKMRKSENPPRPIWLTNQNGMIITVLHLEFRQSGVYYGYAAPLIEGGVLYGHMKALCARFC